MFVHGVGVNGDLGRGVVPRLADAHRCVVPDLPWGSHSLPLRADADLSLPGMARIVADFVAALELDDVTLVANDTGGAVAQALVGRHPQRLPTACGWVTSKPIEEAIMRSYTDPVRMNRSVRRDLTRLLRAVDTRYTYEAAEALRGFDKPALVLWAQDDKIFPREHEHVGAAGARWA